MYIYYWCSHLVLVKTPSFLRGPGHLVTLQHVLGDGRLPTKNASSSGPSTRKKMKRPNTKPVLSLGDIHLYTCMYIHMPYAMFIHVYICI